MRFGIEGHECKIFIDPCECCSNNTMIVTSEDAALRVTINDEELDSLLEQIAEALAFHTEQLRDMSDDDD